MACAWTLHTGSASILQANGAKRSELALVWLSDRDSHLQAARQPSSRASERGSGPSHAAELEGKAVMKPVLMKAIALPDGSRTTLLLGTDPVWQETGRFDEEGHALGARLAERIADGWRNRGDRF